MKGPARLDCSVARVHSQRSALRQLALGQFTVAGVIETPKEFFTQEQTLDVWPYLSQEAAAGVVLLPSPSKPRNCSARTVVFTDCSILSRMPRPYWKIRHRV